MRVCNEEFHTKSYVKNFEPGKAVGGSVALSMPATEACNL